jgi:hypothetical protein
MRPSICNIHVVRSQSPRHGASSGYGWRMWPPDL